MPATGEQGPEDNINRAARFNTVLQRWQEQGDRQLASSLQLNEFGEHFERNRTERRLVGADTKFSTAEQQRERQRARQRAEAERLARERADAKLAAELAERERVARQREVDRQRRQDEELARRLQAEFNGASQAGRPQRRESAHWNPFVDNNNCGDKKEPPPRPPPPDYAKVRLHK